MARWRKTPGIGRADRNIEIWSRDGISTIKLGTEVIFRGYSRPWTDQKNQREVPFVLVEVEGEIIEINPELLIKMSS